MHSVMHSLPCMPSNGSPSRNRWATYVRRTAGTSSQTLIVAATGINQGTVSRWLRGESKPRPETAVSFARSYGANPVEALIAAGILKPSDLPKSDAA